jgi:hypothetical protein
MSDEKFYRGDYVKTIKGAAFRGEVVAVFPTLSGAKRVVVEATSPEYAGTLHVYPVEQVQHGNRFDDEADDAPG